MSEAPKLTCPDNPSTATCALVRSRVSWTCPNVVCVPAPAKKPLPLRNQLNTEKAARIRSAPTATKQAPTGFTPAERARSHSDSASESSCDRPKEPGAPIGATYCRARPYADDVPDVADSHPGTALPQIWRVPPWQPAALILVATVLIALVMYGRFAVGAALMMGALAAAALVGAAL